MKKIEHKIINEVELKWCNIGKKWLDLAKFGKDSRAQDGLRSPCRDCQKRQRKDHKQKIREYNRRWYLANTEKARKRSSKRYQANSITINEQQRALRLANPEKFRKYDREKYQTNPDYRDQCKKRNKKWRLANLERYREVIERWAKNNPEKIKEICRKAVKKYQSTSEGRLHHNVHSAVGRGLRNGRGGKHTFDLLGYTIKQLRKHLESTLPDGYIWDDYMSGKLHLDHIVPISVHNFEKSEDIDFERCWALTNLQLLPAFDNLSKGNKLKEPFQPSFIFG